MGWETPPHFVTRIDGLVEILRFEIKDWVDYGMKSQYRGWDVGLGMGLGIMSNNYINGWGIGEVIQILCTLQNVGGLLRFYSIEDNN